MRIGALSARTGLSTRMLRYYEEQGLLTPDRAGNGYREYDESAVERALRVQELVRAGLCTRMVRVVLDIESQCRRRAPQSCNDELATELAQEVAELDQKIATLARSRDAVAEYLRLTEHGELLEHFDGKPAPTA